MIKWSSILDKKAVVLIHKDYSHLDLIKCLFQIELVEYVFLADKIVNADKDIIELKNKIQRGIRWEFNRFTHIIILKLNVFIS